MLKTKYMSQKELIEYLYVLEDMFKEKIKAFENNQNDTFKIEDLNAQNEVNKLIQKYEFGLYIDLLERINAIEDQLLENLTAESAGKTVMRLREEQDKLIERYKHRHKRC